MSIYSINIYFKNSDNKNDNRSFLFGSFSEGLEPDYSEVVRVLDSTVDQMTGKKKNVGHWPSAVKITKTSIRLLQ